MDNEITRALNKELLISVKKMILESEQARKAFYKMLYAFYSNDVREIKKYIIMYMLGGSDIDKQFVVLNHKTNTYDSVTLGNMNLFSPETIQIMPKCHFDLITKTLNNVCKLYTSGVDRYLITKKKKIIKKLIYDIETEKMVLTDVELQPGDIDPIETNKMLSIYTKMKIDIVSKKWYKMAKFFGLVAVLPVYRNNRVEVDIYTPCNLSVKESDDNYLVADEIAIEFYKTENGQDVLYKSVWSDTEHYIMKQGSSDKISVKDKKTGVENINNINPYGINPVKILRMNEGDCFWSETWLDLVEQNVWYDIKENNLTLVEFFQGIGILFGSNLGNDEKIPITPYMILNYKQLNPNLAPPDLKAIATQAPLIELKENNETFRKTVGNTKGITGYLMDTQSKGTEQPGISKAYDNDEAEQMTEDDKLKLIDFETDLFDIIRIIHNTYEKRVENKLSYDHEFGCEFISTTTQMNSDSKLKKWTYEISEGIKTKVDYLISENPNMTEQQAISILINNKKINDKLGNNNIDKNSIDKNSIDKNSIDKNVVVK
jgi:hypothetical protein